MGLCLYVGMDDSNHCGENIKGEINVATFSFLHEDSIVKLFNNRRNYEFAEKWMQNPKRDYRFTILTGEEWRFSSNLIYTAPLLIDAFLKRKRLQIDVLKVYLDGRLEYKEKILLREQLMNSNNLKNLTIANFIKKNKIAISAYQSVLH